MKEVVLLTGALGNVGRTILSHLHDQYTWRLLDNQSPDSDFPYDVIVADILNTTAVNEAVEGASAIIHLAGDPQTSASWKSVLRNNIEGTQILLEAAVNSGVEKFIFASSNHAVGHYESDPNSDPSNPTSPFPLDGTELPRPGNLYGASKAFGEIMGRYYHDEYGISVLCVRIGNLNGDAPPVDYARGQSMWLSNRDCGHLFDRCLQAHYGYEIVYGVSDNDSSYYSLDRTRDLLGYSPQDNSAEHIS